MDNATTLDETLVAYLDGELDAESARRVDARLAAEPAVRRRLHELQRSWELLDELATEPAGADFTHTTLEMIATAANEESKRQQADTRCTRRRRLWWKAAGLLGAAVVGFALVAMIRSNANEQLAEDLPIIKNLKVFRHAESVEFLQTLRNEGLFVDEPGKRAEDLSGPTTEQLTPSDRDMLRRRWEQFRQLPRSDRKRLRDVYKQLAEAPDRDELRAIGNRYHEWLEELPPLTRSELLTMEPERRIERIKQLLRRQAESDLRRFDATKAAALHQWMADQAERMISRLPESQREKYAWIRNPRARLLALGARGVGPDGRTDLRHLLRDEDLVAFRTTLPSPAAEQMAKLPTEQQWKLIGGWIRQAFHRRRHPDAKTAEGVGDTQFEQRLIDMVENDLSDEQRDRILALPPEKMRDELIRMYMKRSGHGGPPNFRGRGFRGPKPSGFPPRDRPSRTPPKSVGQAPRA